MPKAVMVLLPGEMEFVECPYHDDMTDEENITEWRQGWDKTPTQFVKAYIKEIPMPKGPKNEVKPEGRVVEATGSTDLGPNLANLIGAAMQKAIKDNEAAAKKLWEDESVPMEERRKRVAEMTSPDSIKAVMLKARADAKAAARQVVSMKAANAS